MAVWQTTVLDLLPKWKLRDLITVLVRWLVWIDLKEQQEGHSVEDV